jgi:hypothetical protein
MPKRIIDGEAVWSSDKLAACELWARREYPWLYPLADANGCFEITNLRVIWGKVAAIRPDLTQQRLQEVFEQFTRHGLLFTWSKNGKRYGHWTRSEGRLPPRSERSRHKSLAPDIPAGELAKYLKSYGINEVSNTHDPGLDLGLDLGLVRDLDLVEVEEQRKIAAAAFAAIGFDLGPFGQPAFQEVWTRRFKGKTGDWLTQVMEETIQECQQRSIGVPPQFYTAKHSIEQEENTQFNHKHKTALL